MKESSIRPKTTLEQALSRYLARRDKKIIKARLKFDDIVRELCPAIGEGGLRTINRYLDEIVALECERAEEDRAY